MDKNKNRTDLLAAGRKKLQQYRQKKDGSDSSSRGKSSKKSGKSGKHEHDDSSASTTTTTTAKSKHVVSAKETEPDVDSSHGNVDSSLSHSTEIVAPEVDVATLDSSSVSVTPDTGTIEAVEVNPELPVQEQEDVHKHVTDSSVPSEGGSNQIAGAEVVLAETLATSNVLDLQGEAKTAEVSDMVSVSAPHSVGATGETDVAVEGNLKEVEKEALPSQKDFPDTPLIHTRGYQDSSGSGLKQFDNCGETGETEAAETEAPRSTGLDDAISGSRDCEDDMKREFKTETEKNAFAKGYTQQSSPEGEHNDRLEGPEITDSVLESTLPCLGDEPSLNFLQLQQLVKQLGEDEFRLLLKARESSSPVSLNEALERKENLAVELANCRSELQASICGREDLQNQLYIAKAEADELSTKAHELQISLENSQGELSGLLAELASCNELLAVLQTEKDNLAGDVTSLAEERSKLLEEKESCLHENEKLLIELSDSKNLVAVLQSETSNLSMTIASLTEDRKKLEEEKESFAQENEKLATESTDRVNFVSENERLSSELRLLQEQISTEHGEHMQVEGELKEMTMRLKQLTEETMKTKDIDSNVALLSSQVPESLNQNKGSETGGISTSELGKSLCDSPSRSMSIELCKQENFDDSSGFVVMKRHLQETDKILQELEHAIEGMHAHTTSSTKSTTKIPAPAVSKLIQAFESKGHHDEDEEEGSAIIDKSLTYAFMLTKEQTGNLRNVLKLLMVDAENASVLFKDERDCRKSAEVTYTDLKVQNEDLKEHTDNLEMTNIELGVLYEAVKQHVFDDEARFNELEVLCETLKRQEITIKSENHELGERLNESQSKMTELQTQLHDVQSSSDEIASGLQNQLENLQKEAAERAIIVQAEWSSTIAQFVETVGRLDESIARLSFSSFSPDNLDTHGRIAFSVDAAIKVIEDLQGKVESSGTDFERVSHSYEELKEKFDELRGSDELAISTLHNLHSDLRKLLVDFCGPLGEYEMNILHDKLHDPVAYSQFEFLIKQLEHFLGERLHLESANGRLNSELATKIKDIEEMNSRFLDTNAVQKLIEDVEAIVKPDHDSMNMDRTACSRLESAVALLVQKYKEASAQVSSSREGSEGNMMELTELQNKILELSALNLQHETEILSLRENVHRAEESLTIARSELHEKASELEQSEQRVTSVREKLGIAVAKGKGLIVQRDSFKQSLAETSSELERCSQELQQKDSWLQELEAKLKAYSEAGERVEALESELSYIRNSATALRESFLLKDSALQRIEEILEDLDLPDDFHERDIIEKIDWLARTAMGNSEPVIDADQRSSVGGAHYDSGFLVMDDGNEDEHESSSSGNDLRRKYEELKSRFYGLAEQNDMLEQSLMERNLMVQRWEELLDRISMPQYLRSLEPEGRIEWLASALSEAINDGDSLQLKVDNLENSCESLSVDFEVSQKTISTLQADLQAVIHEREHLSENLEILAGDCEKLSVLTVQLELEKGKLQHEINGLQETLVQNLRNQEHLQTTEADIGRLQCLISDTLQDPGTKQLVSGGSATECLERLLSKLLENYTTLLSQKAVAVAAVDEHHAERADVSVDETSREITVQEETQVATMMKERENDLRDLESVKEERDSYMEKQRSLVSEVEALNKRNEALQELLNQEEQKSATLKQKLNVERDSYMEKQQSLVSEVEALDKRNEELEELLSQEEQKSASLREKLNMESDSYMEKQQSLVSEVEALDKRNAELQELLNQEEQNSASLREKLNVERDRYLEKQQSLVSEVEALDKRNEELQELLDQEEQNSASLRDSYMEKQQTLVSEVEALGKRNEETQKLLNQGEQKSASLRERFNAERDSYLEKQQSLVFEVEALDKRNEETEELLNQEEQKSASLREKLNMERDGYMEKQQSLVSEVEALGKRNEDLQELLNQEEQKSASLREKLNVEGDSYVEKQQSLATEVEALNKRNEEMQELLNQEEQKSASLTEKLNVEGVGYVEKQQSLASEVEALNKRNEELQELLNQEEQKSASLREKLNVEGDSYMEKQQSLASEVEALNKRNEELQELLKQEEHRSTSLREKLNVAVRKGKSLVQYRDSLKQTMEEMSAEIERLKSEIKQQEPVLAEYQVKMRDLSTYSEGLQARESENFVLKNSLKETEQFLQEREHALNMICNALGNIDVDTEVNATDPVGKLERIGIMFRDLHTAVSSSEQESKKSKRAAELLLAELNEVQERNDNLQEELAEASDELAEISRERDAAVAGKLEALSHLEQLSTVDLQEKRKRYSEFMALKLGAAELWESLSDVNNILGDVFSKDLEYLHNLKASLEFCLRRKDAADVPYLSAFGGTAPSFSVNKENVLSMDSWSDSLLPDHFDENSMAEVCSNIRNYLQQAMSDLNSVKAQLQIHPVSLYEQASGLFEVMQIIQREMSSQQELLETTKKDISHLQSREKEKDEEIVVLCRNIGILYEACSSSITEFDNKKAEMVGSTLVAEESRMSFTDGARFSSEAFIRTTAEKLSLVVKDFASLKAETLESDQQELKATVANLQKELQEKDIQKDRICAQLVSQIKEAEAANASYSHELQSSLSQVHDLEKQVELLEEGRKTLEHRVKELHDVQATVAQLQNKATSLSNVVAAKDQEIESLMQALDVEEVQMEDLRNKNEELEKLVWQKNMDYEKLEGSRGKIAKKLSITVGKFDELHDLSENLLAEVEKLQSQLQDRDAEISFLRQEVTRCTNDVLVASQMTNKKNSEEIHEFFTWLDSTISRADLDGLHVDDSGSSVEALEYKETVKKKITSVLSELDDIRAVSQSSDALLQVERSKVEELTHRAETLEKILEEKQHQVNRLGDAGDSGQGLSVTSEIVEVEPVINKWSASGTASQVRSLRKVNNDQVAIAIDADGSHRLEDEDDDKVHGFRSLTSSRIIPKFTRPVSDLIDGLWVSCDRTLQRQPTLRLGIMLYWAVLHALLVAFVV